MEYTPHPLLRSPHLQTLLSSRLVRGRDSLGRALLDTAESLTLTCRDGIRLQAVITPALAPGAPLVVLLHGWLGCADSPYLRRTAAALHAEGFTVARLLLRDHGGTAALNAEMFNAARIDEVVDACNALAERFGTGAALMGFSLGGNFVLRLAAHAELSAAFRTALAVCPVLDPAAAVDQLDRGFAGYRHYFMHKWRRAFAEKEAAFPERYQFDGVRRLTYVSTLTDYLVTRHTPYRDAGEYYGHYTLTGELTGALRIPVRILATEDDPVVPAAHARALLSSAADIVTLTRYGGHCAFIEDLRLGSALDRYAAGFFAAAL